jgi:NosR/NirI family transcriptional regulator, nitrous oxide reductase regulator
MRMVVVALVLATGALLVAEGQAPLDAKLQGQLKQLFPAGTTFSAKEPNPPHFNAFASLRGGPPKLVGFAFWTTELVPLERGYDGPIKMLVGMDTQGLLTGVLVVEHHEPYGNFSIETPAFAAQFKGKSIRDPFKVGADVDAVSRASVSITSASRAIRNSARRIARELMTPEDVK